jgi:hypothetical protein
MISRLSIHLGYGDKGGRRRWSIAYAFQQVFEPWNGILLLSLEESIKGPISFVDYSEGAMFTDNGGK